MPTKTTDAMTQMFDQLNDSFTKTMTAGIKFQEQTARFWSDLFEKNMEDCRTQYDKVLESTAPFNKASLDRFQKMFDQQANTSLEMLKEACELGKVSNPAEFYERMNHLWRSSFDAVRESADFMAKTNHEMLENWSKLVRETAAKANGSKQAVKVGAR